LGVRVDVIRPKALVMSGKFTAKIQKKIELIAGVTRRKNIYENILN
jgi:hypothetical protein